MPKAGAAPVPQELLPVRQGPGPALETVEITPVLTHSRVGQEQREQQILVQQQPVGLRFDRLADLRAKRDEGRQAPRRVDPHPPVDHHEVGVGRQAGRCPVQCTRHRSTNHAHSAAMQPGPNAQQVRIGGRASALTKIHAGRPHSGSSVWRAACRRQRTDCPVRCGIEGNADRKALAQSGGYLRCAQARPITQRQEKADYDDRCVCASMAYGVRWRVGYEIPDCAQLP